MHLTTKRLLLRDYNPNDWQAVFAYQSHPAYLKYYPWHQRNPTDVQEFVQKFIDWQTQQPRSKFQLAVILQQQNKLIGSCGIRMQQADSHQAELGYEISPLYWGQGYATEAAQQLLNYGFEKLGVHRVWASCLAENVSSARVLEKLGMQQEGRIRQNRWMKGRYWDTLLFSILKPEWQSQTMAQNKE